MEPEVRNMQDEEAPDNRANEKVEAIEKDDGGKPKESLEDEGPKMLDLAFAMDCTGSMGSYIHQARQNIRQICEDIVSEEEADIKLALVEYRDHPPQDSSFVTKVHEFTPAVIHMKSWLDSCSANGGGDGPEAVADALEEVRKLDWRPNATKICVFIADAPPHGLQANGDGFPKGCPLGFDPMQVTQQIAELGVKRYMVGCEPSIDPHKEFFMALCHLTGGQYVPLQSARALAKVIVGGAQEELSLQKMIEEVNAEILAESRSHTGELDTEELTTRVHSQLQQKNYKSKHLRMHNESLPQASERAKMWSNCSSMEEVMIDYSPSESSPVFPGIALGGRAGMMHAAAPFRMRNHAPLPSHSPGRMAPASCPMMGMGSDLLAVDELPVPSDRPASVTAANAYGVAEGEVDRNQAERMVQQAIMSNHLGARKKKHS